MSQLFAPPFLQVLDNNGDPVAGGKLYFYETGTTTLLTVYQDADLTTPHTNPVVADSAGQFAPVYLDENVFKIVVKSSADVTIRTVDPVYAPLNSGASDALIYALGIIPFVATRTLLKAKDTDLIKVAYLTEAGRSGLFRFRTGDFSTNVTTDTQEGIYIKADDTASSAGAWVRDYSGPKDVRWFGAKAGSTAGYDATNVTSINAALLMGGAVLIPSDADGDFEINDTIIITIDNTSVVFDGGSFLKLTDSTTYGGILIVRPPLSESPTEIGVRDVTITNPMIDGNDIGWPSGAAYGEVGVGAGFCARVNIIGGIIKRCRRGTASTIGSGGRGLSFQNTLDTCTAEATIIHDCTTGIMVNGTGLTDASNSRFSNITLRDVGRAIEAIIGNDPTSNVSLNSVTFSGVNMYNCGLEDVEGTETDFGLICIDRWSNGVFQNINVWNDADYGTINCLVRHHRGSYNVIDGVVFCGKATNLINSGTPPTGFGTTGARNGNFYRIVHLVGETNYGMIGASADSGNNAGNVYEIAFATLNTAIFDSNLAQSDLSGRFIDSTRTKSIQGTLSSISTTFSAGFTSGTFYAYAGNYQFNNIQFTTSGTTDAIDTVTGQNLALRRGGSTRLTLSANTMTISAPSSSSGLSSGEVYWSTNVLTRVP